MSIPVGDASASAAAADRQYSQSVQVDELVDLADASLSSWTLARVVQLAPDAFFLQPLQAAHPTIRADWLNRTSKRVTRPYTHAETKQQKSSSATNLPVVASGMATIAKLGGVTPHHAALLQPPAALSKQGGVSPHPVSSPPPPRVSSPAVAPSPSPVSAAVPPSPAISESELKKFRSDLRVGDLADFESERWRTGRSGLWFLGEVAKIHKNTFSADDVHVFNHSKGETEVISRDSHRLWMPMTKTEQQQQAAAAAERAAQHAAQQQAASSPMVLPSALVQPSAPVQQPQSSPRQPEIPPRPSPNSASAAQAPLQGRPANMAGGAAAVPGAASSAPVAAAAVSGGEPAPVAAVSIPVAAPVSSAVPVGAAANPPPLVLRYGFQLSVGDVCDALDTEQKWRLAEILSRDQTHVLVHYVDWSSKWDEWIPMSDPRLQPPRTRTDGYTGPANKKPTTPAAAVAAAVGTVAAAPVAKPPAAAPVPPPRPSYTCLAACSWQRVLSTGMSHKEITALNEVFANCCYVQDSYQEVLLGSNAAGSAPAPQSAYAAGSYSAYGWSQPAPAPAFKHSIKTVSALLTKLEQDIVLQQAALPPLCQFPLSQAAAIAANIRSLIFDSEENDRRQLLSQQEDEYMSKLNKKFRIVEVPSDGSCLFSAVGMGQQIHSVVRKLDPHLSPDPSVDEAGAAASSSAPASVSSSSSSSSSSSAASAAPVSSGGGAMSDVASSDAESETPGEEKPVSGDDKDAPADPYAVLTLLRAAGDVKQQHVVAAKCRAALVDFLRARSSQPSASTSDESSWLSKIQNEVKDVLQQEKGGKYSDATSKAVWEELKACSEKQGAGVTPLQLADTPQAVDSYIKVMSSEGIYGTGLELEALSEMLRVPIHVFYRSEAAEPADGSAAASPSLQPVSMLGTQYPGPPICLAYYLGDKHYNLLVDRAHIPDPPRVVTAPSADSVGVAAGAPGEDGPGVHIHGEEEPGLEKGGQDAAGAAPGEEGDARVEEVTPGGPPVPQQPASVPKEAASSDVHVTPGGPVTSSTSSTSSVPPAVKPSSSAASPASKPAVTPPVSSGLSPSPLERKTSQPLAAAPAPAAATGSKSGANTPTTTRSRRTSKSGSPALGPRVSPVDPAAPAAASVSSQARPPAAAAVHTSTPTTPSASAQASQPKPALLTRKSSGNSSVATAAASGVSSLSASSPDLLSHAPPPKPALSRPSSVTSSVPSSATSSPSLSARSHAAAAPAAADIRLRVQFPNHTAAMMRVPLHDPLNSLLSHAYIGQQYTAHATFFLATPDRSEWQQVDGTLSPAELRIADGDSVGIKL